MSRSEAVLLDEIEGRRASAPDPGEVVAWVAHEMRTPLTALVQALKVMDSGRAGALTPEQARFVRMGLSNADALLELTLRLHESERWRTGSVPVCPQRFDAAALALRTVESLAALASGRGVGLGLDVEAGSPAWTWGDEPLVREVLQNLLGNALKFTPAGGTVLLRVDASSAAGRVELLVSDTGPGIAPGEEERIFERYWQSRSARRQRGQGTGLGLAITRAIVEAHGGTVTAARRPGGGSAFRVLLPAFGSGAGTRAHLERFLAGATGAVLLAALASPGVRAEDLLARLDAHVGDGVERLDLGAGRVGLAWSEGRGERAALDLKAVLAALAADGCRGVAAGVARHPLPASNGDELLDRATRALDQAFSRRTGAGDVAWFRTYLECSP